MFEFSFQSFFGILGIGTPPFLHNSATTTTKNNKQVIACYSKRKLRANQRKKDDIEPSILFLPVSQCGDK